MPAVRQDLARLAAGEAARRDSLRERAEGVGRVDLARQFTTDDLDHLGRTMQLAELYWVTGPMSDVALRASLDVPTIDAERAPARHGLMGFANPLPAYPVPGGLALRGVRTDVQHDEPVPVDAIAWAHEGDTLAAHLICRADRLPHPLHGVGSLMTPFLWVRTPARAELDTMQVLTPEGVGSSGSLGVLAFLMSAWVLMMTPTVAERRELDGEWGGPATTQTRPERLVTSVDLRPLRHVQVDHDPKTGRRLTTRHLVRGHWTQQVYGPGQELRRTQWIADYIRGPEGAPLVMTERVSVWRR